MAENYVRPSTVGYELPSRRAAIWRFRIMVGLVLLLIAIGVAFLVRAIIGSSTGNAQGAPRPAVHAAQLPTDRP